MICKVKKWKPRHYTSQTLVVLDKLDDTVGCVVEVVGK